MAEVYDFLVIGGGIAGASAGYELARHGKVGVIEQESQTGYHSTGRSAAMFIEGYGSAAWRAIGAESRAFLENPPDGFTDQPILRPRGDLSIARDTQGDALRGQYEKVTGEGVNLEWLEGRAIAELAPVLREDQWRLATYEPGSADIDVDTLHRGYLRGLRERGGVVLCGQGADAICKNGADWRVSVGANTLAAPVIVNAAGAWADAVARRAGLAGRGLTPRRRTAILFDPPPDQPGAADWCMVGDFAETFYYRPQSGQIMASPADETPCEPCDCQPEELDVAIIADRLEKATRMEVRRIAHSWAGLRTFAADRNPVLGADPDDPSFIWYAGQGGTGIVAAPGAARIVAAAATGEGVPAFFTSRGLDPDTTIAPDRLEPVP